MITAGLLLVFRLVLLLLFFVTIPTLFVFVIACIIWLALGDLFGAGKREGPLTEIQKEIARLTKEEGERK